jgi:hypothetical protein
MRKPQFATGGTRMLWNRSSTVQCSKESLKQTDVGTLGNRVKAALASNVATFP